MRREWPRGGGEVRRRRKFPTRLWHVLEGVWLVRRVCGRFARNAAIPALLRAFLRLFLCATAGRNRGKGRRRSDGELAAGQVEADGAGDAADRGVVGVEDGLAQRAGAGVGVRGHEER